MAVAPGPRGQDAPIIAVSGWLAPPRDRFTPGSRLGFVLLRPPAQLFRFIADYCLSGSLPTAILLLPPYDGRVPAIAAVPLSSFYDRDCPTNFICSAWPTHDCSMRRSGDGRAGDKRTIERDVKEPVPKKIP